MQKKLAATLTGGFLGLVFVLNSSIAGAEVAAEVKYPGLRLSLIHIFCRWTAIWCWTCAFCPTPSMIRN